MRGVILSNDANVFLYRKINGFLFKNKNISMKYLLNAETYLKKNKNEIILKFTDHILFKRMWTYLNISMSLLNMGYYFDLRLKGLGFRIRKGKKRKAKRYYKFFLGHTVYKFFFKPKYFILKTIQKFQMLIFSPFIGALNHIITHLLLFRVIKPYKIKGVINRRQFYVLKPGKVR